MGLRGDVYNCVRACVYPTYEAFGLKGRVASSMLGVLVSPKNPIRVKLADPVLLHVGKQVKFAVGFEPVLNGLALVRRNGRAVRLTVGRVGTRLGVVLAAKVAVLSVRA